MKMRKSSRAGFTLLEIMVVVVIIGLIAAIVIRQLAGSAAQARVELTRANISQIEGALDHFKLNHGRYPDALEELVAMPNYVKPEKWPQGGYLKRLPLDAWGNPFRYTRTQDPNVPYEIVSLGADGREGGVGDEADISNIEETTQR